MSATDLAPTPTRQQLAAIGRSAPGKVTGRLKIALDAMIWQGLKRDDAAKTAGLTINSLYVALARPHVKAWYLRQLDVLRNSGRSRRIHRLEELSEQDDNKQAAINAIRALDYIEDEQHQRHSGAFSSSPGLVIVVNAGTGSVGTVVGPQPPTIEHDDISEA